MGWLRKLWDGAETGAEVTAKVVNYGVKQPKEWKSAADAVASRPWFPSIFKDADPE